MSSSIRRAVDRRSTLVLCLATLAGCEHAVPADTEVPERILTGALVSFSADSGTPDVIPWPRSEDGKHRIDLCFKTLAPCGEPRSDGGWVSLKDDFLAAIRETWEANSSLIFVDHGWCESASNPQPTPKSWMPVLLRLNDPGRLNAPYYTVGFASYGQNRRRPTTDPNQDGSACNYCDNSSDDAAVALHFCQACDDCQVVITVGVAQNKFRLAAVHEMGHALGFDHSWCRSDFPGCTNVLDGGVIPAGPPVGGDCQGGSRSITAWDVDSIMGNFECSAIRNANAPEDYQLTALDKVSLLARYPLALEGRAFGTDHGLYTSDGVIVREDDHITTDWTADGVLGDVFKAPPTWTTNGIYAASAYSVAASSWKQDSGQLFAAVWNDYWGRRNQCQSVVVIDDAQHTALLASLL